MKNIKILSEVFIIVCKVKFVVEERWKKIFLSEEQSRYFLQDKL